MTYLEQDDEEHSSVTINHALDEHDLAGDWFTSFPAADSDTTGYPARTWAVWAPVPEPSTWTLLALGLVALAAVHRFRIHPVVGLAKFTQPRPAQRLNRRKTMPLLRTALCALIIGAGAHAHAATAGLSYLPDAGFLGTSLTLADLDAQDGLAPSITGWEGAQDQGGYGLNSEGAFGSITKPPGYFDSFLGVTTTDIGLGEAGGYVLNLAFRLSPKSAVTAAELAKGFVSTGDFGQRAIARLRLVLSVGDPDGSSEFNALWSVSDQLDLFTLLGAGPTFLNQSKRVQVTIENHSNEPMWVALSRVSYVSARTYETPSAGAVDALPVPEPKTAALTLMGLFALAAVARRRRPLRAFAASGFPAPGQAAGQP